MIMPQYSTFFDPKKDTLGKALPEKNILRRILLGDMAGSKVFLWGVKVVVLALMLYFIRMKVVQGQFSFGQIVAFGAAIWNQTHWILLPFALLLVLVNWALEAKKWQLLVMPLTSVSLGQATRAVLTGLSLGFITPRSIGDYAGRILETPALEREGLVGAVLFNRLSQSLITYLGGLGGLFFLYQTTSVHDQALWGWLIPLLVVGALGSLFFLHRGRFFFLKFIRRYSLLRILTRLLAITGIYTSAQINAVIFYAFLRYLVFSFQFVLVLWLSGIMLPISALFAGVAVVFMLKSVIPAFNFLSDLGVREFSALLVFSVFEVPENQILLASLLVWCLNILMPTIIGSVYVFRLRLNRSAC